MDGQCQSGQMFKFNSRFLYHAQIKVFNALSVKIKNLFKMFKEMSNRS